jgi:outer membrane receptor protein involved in Fe transport
MNKVALGALLVVLGTASQRVSWAQAGEASSAGSSSELKEVVVTAERRTEKLMDVPMSVTALSQEAIEAKGLHNIDDLSRVAPGVTFFRNGMSASGNYNDEDSDISIRGIQSSAGASTTGIYIDDTPIQTRHLNFGTVNPYPSLFDLERVEVLKGPQGTLFGSGSEGGTLRFITPAPGLTHYSGFAKAEFGQVDGGGQNYEAGAAFGGPIIDGVLGFRISASFREDGGWVDRVNYTRPVPTPTACNPTVCFGIPASVYTTIPEATGTTESHSNWHDTQTFRAALRWVPSENLTIDPSFYIQTLHVNDTAAYWPNISNPADNVYRNGNAQRNPSTDPWYVAALKIDWHEPWADIVSNTSYFSREQHSVSDYTQWISTVFLFNQYPPAGDTSTAYFTDHQDNFSQEFRLSSTDPTSRLQWTAGVFYLHAHENSTEFIYSQDLAPNEPNYLGYSQPEFSMLDKQLAVFGELNFKLTQVLSATAGLRYSKLDYSGVVKEQQFEYFGNLNVDSTSSGSDKPLTPRFVLNYTPNPDSLYYASAAKGFRPGGINTELPTECTGPYGITQAPTTFGPDSLWQYEIGAKNTLADHRLQVSAALYYIDWKNIQQFVYLTCGLGFDYNLGSVTGKGGDIEVNWRATPDLTLGFMAAYTDSSYDSDVPLGPYLKIVTKGDHLLASPWNMDLNAEYVWNGVARRPYVRLDYQYATAQNSLVPYINPANAPLSDPTLPGLPEIRVLDIRAGLRFDALDLSLFVHNALNYHTPLFVSRDLATTAANGYTSATGQEVNFDTNYFARGLPPRTYGLTALYRF